MGIKEKYQSGDTITWLQVHNLLPLLAVLVSAVIFTTTLSNKVGTLEEKNKDLSGKIEACFSRTAQMEQLNNQNQGAIDEIKQRLGSVKGVAVQPTFKPQPRTTIVPSPTKTP